jgi:hypothetical protein
MTSQYQYQNPGPNSIVTVQVSTIFAPYPATLQQTGAIVSFGGTNTPASTISFLTRFSDLAPLAQATGAITSAVWATGIVTLDLATPLPAYATSGTIVRLAIDGMTPTPYNGVFDCTVVTPSSVTYPLVSDPGGPGVVTNAKWQLSATNVLNAQVATFFRQGSGVGVYILELGFQTDFAAEVTALETFINTTPFGFYGYLLPDYWGSVSNIPGALQLYQQFVNPEAMIYFWTTIDLAAAGTSTTRGLIDDTNKSVIQLVEAPGVAAARAMSTPGQYAEFTLAGVFYWALRFKATAVTRVSPMCFKFIYGVTPYPPQGNGPTLVGFKNNAVNYIQAGAEGGIANTYIYQGVTADGFDYFNWWWTIDWMQININQDLANAIINGSNNPGAPLYYNQSGISTLQTVLAGTMISGIQFGMVLGSIVQTAFDPVSLTDAIEGGKFAQQCNVNAVPFGVYTTLNPSDYGQGEYDGLSVLFIPARGFVHVLVSVVATNLVTL